MQQLYAPWRNHYLSDKPSDSCVFCGISQNPNEDEKNFVFYRDSTCFGVMNLYPYTPAHLLFIPHNHVDTPELLPIETWLHLQNLAYQAFGLLRDFGAEGINSGINIQKSAGAGIPEHLHLHVVPRYGGDTNFMSIIANCRVYGNDFFDTYHRIKKLAKDHLNLEKEYE